MLHTSQLLSLVRRLALVFSLAVTVALPASFFYLNYSNLIGEVTLMAQVKADALAALASSDPEMWKYNYVRMDEMLRRKPIDLAHERITVRDAVGDSFLNVGGFPDAPTIARSSPVYDFGRAVGSVEITRSYRGTVFGTIAAALLGLLIGIVVYAVSTLPLRALRRSSAALAEEQAALRKSEEHYRALFDTASDGIMICLPDGKLVSVNDAFARMHGYNSDEILAINLSDLDGPNTEKLIEERMQRILSGESISFEAEHFHKDGHLFPLEVTASLIRSEGQPFIQALHRDISERKQAELERARMVERLNESQKMEALGTLAGGVAHDFNNVLAIISGNLELARQDLGQDHPARESLEEIAKASRRSKDLVQQILAFSRRQTLDRKPTSLSLVVLESARLLRASLPSTLSLNVSYEAETPPVMANASQINQVLLNLCSNAAHAVESQESPGVIDVRLEACTISETRGELRPGRYARLTVRDNGSGMDETIRSRIFEPFYTTKPVGRGTGLGLSVVHGILHSHEASVEVESAPGHGSTFRVYFPAVEVPVTDSPATAPKSATATGKGKSVLFVDDEKGLVQLMKRLLERQGFRISGYTDPREALSAVRADPDQFDLVVTDYSMPLMSGLDLAQALREVRADLPVIMASGYITDELRAKAPAAGICELIYKPNTVEDLCEAIVRNANVKTRAEHP